MDENDIDSVDSPNDKSVKEEDFGCSDGTDSKNPQAGGCVDSAAAHNETEPDNDDEPSASGEVSPKGKRSTKTSLAIGIPIAIVVNIVVILASLIFIPQLRYDQGMTALNKGNYEGAYEHFASAGWYRYSDLYAACALAADGIYGDQEGQKEAAYNGIIKDSAKAKEALNIADSIANSNNSIPLDNSYLLYKFLSGEYAFLSGDLETAKNCYSYVSSSKDGFEFNGISVSDREGAMALNGIWKLTSYYGPNSSTGNMVSKSGYELNNFGRNDDEAGFVPFSEWVQEFNAYGDTWFQSFDFLFDSDSASGVFAPKGIYKIVNSTCTGTHCVYNFSIGVFKRLSDNYWKNWTCTIDRDIITMREKSSDGQDKIYTLERI